jgi:hypothetical protein
MYKLRFLAFFPKMKVGLSNHQSVCLCVPPLITFELLSKSSRFLVGGVMLFKEGRKGMENRNNQELRNMYGKPDIIAEFKSKRLEWLGHVVIMEENRTVKRVFEGNLSGKRKTGRPRKRWLDDIEENLRLMKVKRWRKKATEREVGKNRLGGQGPACAVTPRSK